jgi:hypothetical protein
MDAQEAKVGVRRFFSRDAIGWTLTALVAAVTFLSSLPPPTQWGYYQWLGVISAAGLWISGKMAWSPQPLKKDVE